uniref:Tyrosine-protein kinase n=1 Tax=Parastrongyloides trichosuri TaxID=131310 RepID=A0A0N4ZFX9_PARTI
MGETSDSKTSTSTKDTSSTTSAKSTPSNPTVAVQGKKLEDQEWFHAMRPRADIQNLVRNDGDWLVRVTDARGNYEIVITVRGHKGKLHHYTLGAVKDKGFYLNIISKDSKNIKYFPTPVELIEYYRADKPLPGKVYLKNPIIKPTWLIKRTQIKYDENTGELGRGNFAIVYKGAFTNGANQTFDVAIKVAIMDTNDVANMKSAKDDLMKEAKIMSFLVNDNVIRFYGISCDEPPVILVMELCPGGALNSHLKKEEKNISEVERILYGYEICKGCAFLHSKDIIHRDLAARNCLISQEGIIKISDFGLSRMTAELKHESFWSQKIPLAWMAPETLVHNPKYSEKSDVWSFGVVLFEIFSNGGKPWPDMEPKKMATLIRKVKLWDMPSGTPKMVLDVVGTIFKADPESRPDFKSLMATFKDYIIDHKASVPVKDLTVNKIKGVKRHKYFTSLTEKENSSNSTSVSKSHSKESSKDTDEEN